MKKDRNTFQTIPLFFFVITLAIISSLFITNDVFAATKLNKTKATINVGDKLNLNISGTTKKVRWSSSKKSVASVSKKGVVTPKKKGSATITATVGSKKLKCKIKVRTVYTISKKSKLIDVGSNRYSTYGSAYVNSYTKDWYLFRCYLEKLQNSGGGTLVVKKGTYNITNTICIPSNVNIIFMNGVVINKTTNTHTSKFKSGLTLFEFVPSNKYNTKNWCSKYNGVHDSKLIGKGKVKVNLNDVLYSVGITMCHNKNISISGLSFSNIKESHFIELDASKNVQITNCSFSKMKGENYNREAINIDTPDDKTGGFSKTWAKNDKTPNADITISGCDFSDLYVAIGTHQYSQNGSTNIYHTNINIKNCKISNTEKYGISALNWKDAKITNTTFTSCKNIGIYGAGAIDPFISDNTFNSIDTAIRITHSTRSYSTTYSIISDNLLNIAKTKNIFKNVKEEVITD